MHESATLPTAPPSVSSTSTPQTSDQRSPNGAPTRGYRPPLDGLRACAVTAVFAYHLGAPWMLGGFLGVDLFFVLSGYLITGLLLAEHASTGRISLPGFWTRRARRLAPALLVVIVGIAVAVRVLRPVTEWPGRDADLIWTLFYGANWHQIITSQDYFAAWTGASPLRHMWSIAIEEQFYIVWPIVVLLALKLLTPRRLLPLVVLGAAASAGAALWMFDPANPTRVYMGTDTRAFELLAGAALATLVHDRRPWLARLAPFGGLAGLGAAVVLLVGMIRLHDTSPRYYRGGAILVTLAAAALIWSVDAAPKSPLARLLSLRPLTWLGRISYGLYLWHWPAILFTPTLLVVLLGGRGLALGDNPLVLALITIGVALSLTVVSYYVLEQPIRHGRLSRLLPPLRVAIAGGLAFAAVFFAVRRTLAVPDALLAQVRQSGTECEAKMDTQKVEIPTCLVVNGGPGRPVMAMMGDSVAKSMHPAFAALAQAHGWTFLAAAHNRCTVVPRRIVGEKWESCSNAIPVIQAQVLAAKPALIVISDNWLPVDSYDDKGVLHHRNEPEHIADIERRLGLLLPELTAQNALVVLMRYLPESAQLDCADPLVATTPRCQVPAVHPRFAQYNAMLDRVARRFPDRVRVIDLADVVCPNGLCSARVGGIILRYDTLHFSEEGTRILAPHIERKLREVGVTLGL